MGWHGRSCGGIGKKGITGAGFPIESIQQVGMEDFQSQNRAMSGETLGIAEDQYLPRTQSRRLPEGSSIRIWRTEPRKSALTVFYLVRLRVLDVLDCQLCDCNGLRLTGFDTYGIRIPDFNQESTVFSRLSGELCFPK